MENKFKNYIDDTLEELIDRSIEAKSAADQNKDNFQNGRALAYSEVVSYLLNQAEVFQIKDDLKDRIKDFMPPL